MLVRLELSRLFVAFTIEVDNTSEDHLRTADRPGQRAVADLVRDVVELPALRADPRGSRSASWPGWAASPTSTACVAGAMPRTEKTSRRRGRTRWSASTRSGALRLAGVGAARGRDRATVAGTVRAGRGRRPAGRAGADGRVPRCPCRLPVAGQRIYAEAEGIHRPPADEPDDLVVLLSRVLLAYTLEVERDAPVSLPVGLNVLRVLTPEGVAVRDLPTGSGVSKEGIGMVLNLLVKAGRAMVETNPPAAGSGPSYPPRAGRDQRLLERGRAVETRWGSNLDRALAAFDPARLAEGLRPPPNCWRAQPPYRRWTDLVLADPASTLPHYPMVLHRGGFPDGSYRPWNVGGRRSRLARIPRRRPRSGRAVSSCSDSSCSRPRAPGRPGRAHGRRIEPTARGRGRGPSAAKRCAAPAVPRPAPAGSAGPSQGPGAVDPSEV